MRRWITRRFSSWPLFGTIAVWVVLALAAFTILGWVWGQGGLRTLARILTNWRAAENVTHPLERVRVSLTMIGGIGAVGYLVIKYRDRAGIERGEADAKLRAGIDQLGSQSPQVRIAGVYALAAVADTYRAEYRQRVVDILCGYLHTKRGELKTVSKTLDVDSQENFPQRYVSDDGAVESTILTVLAKHLRKKRAQKKGMGATKKDEKTVQQEVDDDQLWCDCNFDLHGASFIEKVVLNGAVFFGRLDASGARFNERVYFRDVVFSEDADFESALFGRDVDFVDAYFQGDSHFVDTKFRGRMDFSGATFRGSARFENVKVEQFANFDNVIFGGLVSFMDARFRGLVSFMRADFRGDAILRLVTFCESVHFNNTTFGHRVDLRGSTFTKLPYFTDTRFIAGLYYRFDPFGGEPSLEDAVFEGSRFNHSFCDKFENIWHLSVTGDVPDIDEKTGLPCGARWGRFDEAGALLEYVDRDGNPIENASTEG